MFFMDVPFIERGAPRWAAPPPPRATDADGGGDNPLFRPSAAVDSSRIWRVDLTQRSFESDQCE